MDVFGAFVGEDAFEVGHVAHGRVFFHDAVGAEEVAGGAGDVEGDADVVALEQGDVFGLEAALILEAAAVEGEELALGEGGDHVGE